LLATSTLIFFIASIKSGNGFFLLGEYICGIISGGYLGNELNKTVLTNIGDKTDIFDNEMISIRNALKKKKY